MASTVFPAPSAASKTMFRTTLISGTSYTVPAGVTYLNVTLIGGGGGAPGTNNNSSYSTSVPGSVVSSTLSVTAGASIAYAIGAGGTGSAAASFTNGNAGGTTTFTGATSADGGGGGKTQQFAGSNGANYQGAGNAAAHSSPDGTASYAGPNGGSGCIIVEYWA